MFLVFAALPLQVSAEELSNSISLKVSIHEKENEYIWEYRESDIYLFSKNGRMYKGAQAEKEVQKIVRMLQLTEQADVNQMAASLKGQQYKQLERLDIRWINKKNELYTWVWSSD